MKNIQDYWDNLSENKKRFIIKNNLFWDGLFHIKFEYLPDEFIETLKKQLYR